jgi:hypothetical protein
MYVVHLSVGSAPYKLKDLIPIKTEFKNRTVSAV